MFFSISFLFVVAAMVYDWISRGRLHRADVWGGVIGALRLTPSSTAAWQAFARWLVA